MQLPVITNTPLSQHYPASGLTGMPTGSIFWGPWVLLVIGVVVASNHKASFVLLHNCNFLPLWITMQISGLRQPWWKDISTHKGVANHCFGRLGLTGYYRYLGWRPWRGTAPSLFSLGLCFMQTAMAVLPATWTSWDLSSHKLFHQMFWSPVLPENLQRSRVITKSPPHSMPWLRFKEKKVQLLVEYQRFFFSPIQNLVICLKHNDTNGCLSGCHVYTCLSCGA